MNKKIIYDFKVDGLYHSVNYYREESPINPLTPPPPRATGITELSFTDEAAEVDKIYHVRFSSVRGDIEKFSSELMINTSMGRKIAIISVNALSERATLMKATLEEMGHDVDIIQSSELTFNVGVTYDLLFGVEHSVTLSHTNVVKSIFNAGVPVIAGTHYGTANSSGTWVRQLYFCNRVAVSTGTSTSSVNFTSDHYDILDKAGITIPFTANMYTSNSFHMRVSELSASAKVIGVLNSADTSVVIAIADAGDLDTLSAPFPAKICHFGFTYVNLSSIGKELLSEIIKWITA